MGCENCRHLTAVGLHDTGPRPTALGADALTSQLMRLKRKLPFCAEETLYALRNLKSSTMVSQIENKVKNI